VIARFIGQDGSLGYRTGQVYHLDVRRAIFSDKPHILRPRPCPYSSWAAFWANWELVPTPVEPS